MSELLSSVEDSIGVRIRRLRQQRGMSQGDLALATYYYQSRISAIERGRGRLRVDQLALFAGALGVTPAELLGSGCPHCGADSGIS